MGLLGIFVVLFTAGQIFSPAPDCGRSSMMKCLMPMVMYFMGPEGPNLTDTNMNYTDKQYRDFCRLAIPFADCYKDFVFRCAAGFSDAQQFAAKAVQYIRRCDTPSFGNDTRTLSQCMNTLNRTKSKTTACSNAAVRWTRNDLRGLLPTEDGAPLDLKAWNNGSIFDSLCCNTKYYRQCSGSEVNETCGPHSQQLFNSFQEAAMIDYDCSARMASCPVRGDPIPEDYTPRMEHEFMSLVANNTHCKTCGSKPFETSASDLVRPSYSTVWLVLVVIMLLSAQVDRVIKQQA